MAPPPAETFRPSTARVLPALIGLWLCWGTSFPAIRVMVRTLPPLTASGAVFVVAGAALAAAQPGVLRRLTRRQTISAAAIGLGLLGAQGAVAAAERFVYASTAALLVAVIPLWVVIFQIALGDRPHRATVLRLVLGFAGVAVVLVASSSSATLGWSTWTLVVLAAAICWAGATLAASRSPSMPGPRAATIVQLLTGGLALLVVGATTGELGELEASGVAVQSAGAMLYLIAVDSLAGFVLYNWLLRTASVALVSTYAYAVPVVAYAVGVLILGEPFHPAVLAGAAAIVAAIASEVRPRRRGAPGDTSTATSA